MDAADWRTQLPHDARQKMINKIAETIDKCIPFSVPDGMNEPKRIAAGFEERIFRSAVNQIDYLRIIASKMMTVETKYLNSANNGAPLDQDTQEVIESDKVKEIGEFLNV